MDQKDAAKSVSKPTNQNEKISWPQSQSNKQIFDFPDSIIYYISKNPSTPKAYLKMAKSCKLFFEKNPILIVTRIHDDFRKLCSKKNLECHYCEKCCVEIDITRLSSKIWLTTDYNVSMPHNPNFVPVFISKLFRCEKIVSLQIIDKTISLHHLQLFGSKFHEIYFHDVQVIDNDGNAVMLDKILESITNLKIFYYWFNNKTPAATKLTMKNINKLSNLGNLYKILLNDIPEVINIEELGKFIKNQVNTKFWLHFNWYISDEYKNKLDKLIDVIIDSGVPYRVITYNDQNQEKWKIMQSRCAP